MQAQRLRFSIAAHSAWAPGVTTAAAWRAWADSPHLIAAGADAPVAAMPAMLRRRAGTLGKMALEVAYASLQERSGVPTIFCSRHGDVARAVELLTELAQATPLSPAGFGLAVHNAIAGLLSIARTERANHIALAAGPATIEHGVIEACSLLADGAPLVLLVAYDCPLPAPLASFQDCEEQPHAWAWLVSAAAADPLSLSWAPAPQSASLPAPAAGQPGGLDILRFQLSGARSLVRQAGQCTWTWERDA